jgi:hypothetical protein
MSQSQFPVSGLPARPARTPLPRRTVHLDFHTGPDIPEVGSAFEPDAFAAAFAAAKVDSVTLFAKCHHGHLYYDTPRLERHPGLPASLNLLDEQIEALHAIGIKTPIYLSMGVDEYAANARPEWIALEPDGRQVKRYGGRFNAGWYVLDMDSPYQEYFTAQLTEVLDHFGTVDGIFLDMCWDQPSASVWAVKAMRADGLDPASPADRDRHARAVAHRYMARFRNLVVPRLAPDATMAIWFNSRPKTALGTELGFIDHVEIEALPTGGWGYTYLPYVSRFVRPLGVPALAHTGRFHKSWGDSGGLKSAASLKYECAQMITRGLAACVGDLLPPDARPAPAAYRLIGGAYEYLERCEPFVAAGEHQVEAAVLVDPGLGDSPGPAGAGIVRALQRHRIQFDVLAPDAPLDGYELVIVPELTLIDPGLAARVKTHLAAGGALLVSGAAALDGAGAPALPELGIAEAAPSPFSHTFLREAGNPDGFPHVMYEPVLRLNAQPAAEVLYEIIEPYFERSWNHFSGHDYTPADVRPTPSGAAGAAVILHGRTGTFAAPIFTAIGRHAATAYQDALGTLLDRLLPDPLLRAAGPAHLETAVVDTPGSRVVHLLSFVASRQAEGVSPITGQTEGIDLVDDPFPLVDLPISVRSPAAPRSVILQPHGIPLAWEHRDGRVRATVTIADGHGMIVIEYLFL